MSKKVLMVYSDLDRVPAYRDALIAANLEPQIVKAGSDIPLEPCDGLLLMGGEDVDPQLYGEPRLEHTDGPNHALDQAEFAALEQALAHNLPILAICRGMQVLNVYFRGSLVQHLTPVEDHRVIKNNDRSLPVHSVAVERDTLLARTLGAAVCAVNSRHHQAVKALGSGLTVSAVHPHDGVIEAIELRDRKFVLGVQWHPEDQIRRDPVQLRLFQQFAKAIEG